ncbi:ATP-binding protein [Limosilactobacillus balticus]|uniref:ATP-binding protein n=1 Tax=Limosilactobacillus balticus TaxID=2759747 RepID=UPI001E2B0009|nr:ATP-binding protein [Limosilactobacillus balticus]MCD7132632.1 AAA family ATPase [Limosilactobacillus balticus]
MVFCEINELSISNFRGISKTRKLIFTKNSKPRSILIYGDNGTGKSSFLDAIEFIAQGTIQNRRTTSSGDWIYSSNSQSATKVCCKFDNGLCVEKDYVFEDNKLNIVTFKNEEELNKNISIPSFCHALLVLRRRDIIKFWDLDSIERMKIFIPFASPKNDVGFIPITEQEKIDRIN